MFNPNFTATQYCIIAPTTQFGTLVDGMHTIGPFPSEETAVIWADENIIKSGYDNPHWVVRPMTVPK